ncbi:hypothetical protein BDB00DRAFT_761374, partial [Zychaea mexicana]|uniref:uncharacterized protein n=1 Tax=Zychaea mexicana TaxID=64656 RepID=UPI0022FDD14E
IPESGTIACVEMVNFMCHKYLRIDLGPKINFVIGHNGSGKSAIMTALTIALGAKASSTNRGKNLCSFIREGENAALITVTLTNKGPDAYRNDVYGDKIVIDRKIMKDGTGQYKIKSAAGKIISFKREELTAVCDHMNIQVDNPLTVLSQDNAREFLNASSPKDKYRLFMRGTQLSTLAEDYDDIGEKLNTTCAIVDRKKRVLPDLKRKADDAKQRYTEALERDKLEEQLETLGSELAWVQVNLKEKEAEASRQNAEAAEHKVREIAEQQRQSDEYHASVTLNVEGKQRENQLMIKAQTRREELKVFSSDAQKINAFVKTTKQEVVNLTKDIDAETAKQEASSQAENDARQAKLDELEQAKAEKEEQARNYRTEIGDLEVQVGEYSAERNSFANKFSMLEKQRRETQQRLDALTNQKADRLRAFGRFVPEVLRDIEAERRWTRKPVGPFGRYLKLKYPEYTETMEIVLGKVLNSFVVENYDDRKLLSLILERRKMGDTLIIVSKHDLFDFSEGEPDARYLTMLRALEFSDEWVKRQIIVARDIEKLVLIGERREADDLMLGGGPRNVKACYTTKAQKVTGQHGLKTEALQRYRGPPREMMAELRKLDVQSSELKQARQQVQNNLEHIRNRLKELQVTVEKALYRILCQKLYAIDREIRAIVFNIRQVQESMKEEEPVNLQMLKDRRDELQGQINGYVGQFSEIRKQDDETRKEIADITVRLQQFEADEEEHAQKMRNAINEIDTLLHKALRHQSNMQENLNQSLVRVDELNKKADLDERTVEEWTRQVMAEWPQRVDTRRTPDQIQRQIRHLEMRIEERNRAIGATMEEIEEEARTALEALKSAKNTIGLLDRLKRELRSTLEARMDHWTLFRMYISLSATGHFTYFMHKRGYNGYLKFNHDKERLDVRVSTSDQMKRGTRHKDSKTLSGGEKSFSQISLLLSLWEGISSPVYCLDEFDVYMDAVNRKQSMRMMVSDIRMQDKQTYVNLSMIDASNMVPGPYIKVHRLSDPERQQPHD